MPRDGKCDVVGCGRESDTTVRFTGSDVVNEFCDGHAAERVAIYDEAEYYDPELQS